MEKKNIFVLRNPSCIRSWKEIYPDAEGEQVRNFSEDDYKDGEIIWRTRHKYVKKLDIPGPNGRLTVVYKHYCEKRFWRYLFRPSLAWRETEGYCLAAAFDIPIAKILSCGENRSFFNLYDSWIMTKYLDHTQDGSVFAGNDSDDPEFLAEKISFCRQNLEYIARLHKAGYTHGGTHPRNFLFQKKPGEKTIQVIWIDLATIRKRKFRLKKHLHDDLRHFLSPLHLSGEELKEMIAYYNQFNPGFSPDPATLHVKIK